MKGIKVYLDKMSCPFPRVHNSEISKIVLLQNHLVNFNQTGYKGSLGEGNSSLLKKKKRPRTILRENDSKQPACIIIAFLQLV